MNVKLRVLTVGVLFFTGQAVMAQKDSTKVQDIEEVVVVAFGKQKKEAIVGSVTTVDEKVIANQQAPSVTSALQGTAVGVNVITSGGQPGGEPSILVRGIGSINSSTDPLIVLDGSPYNGNINNIPQDQVESITVLKDAGSTALYGSRAANGVIIITTKKGRLNSKPKVTVTSIAGVGMPAVDLHETLNAADFMQYSWQAIRNANVKANVANPGQAASNSLIRSLGYNPYNVANPIDANGNLVAGAQLLWDTDWENELINRAAYKQEHRFNVSGGDAKTTYFLGADYLDVAGSVKTANFERAGIRLNVESKVKDWLKVGMNSAFTGSTSSLPIQSGNTYGSSIQWIYSLPNIYPLYRRDPSGALIKDGFGNNIYDYGANGASKLNSQRPLFENENAVGALYNNYDIQKRTSSVINGFAEIDLMKDLTFRTQLSYEQYLYDQKAYDNYAVGAAASVGGRVSQQRTVSKTINYINSLSYDKKFGDHSVGLQGVFEVYDYKYDRLDAQGTGFLPGTDVLSVSTKPEYVAGYINQERLTRYLGRATYNYKNKYFAEGSFSYDKTSRFSPEDRAGSFYGVGASWVISRESFLEDSRIFNLLKLRASYGELGNNQVRREGVDNYFPYLAGFAGGYPNLGQSGVVLDAPANEHLTWEASISTTVGLDFGLFGNRITGSVDYFKRESKDLIFDRQTPGSVGFTRYLDNVGSLENYGWEINLNTVNVKNDKFLWTSNLNVSTFKNKITDLYNAALNDGNKRLIVGGSRYDFFLPEWAGVDAATGMGTWFTTDANGARVVTQDFNIANRTENKIISKSSIPDFAGGFTNYFKVGPVDLNVLFNYSFGSYVFDSTYQALMAGFARPGYQQHVDIKNAWQQPGDITDVPINLQTANNNNASSTRFLFKNDYVRLKSLTLGFNVNKDLLESLGVNQFRIFAQGDNIWTWQSHKGIDPEQNISGNTDNRSYQSRTISLGVTVGF